MTLHAAIIGYGKMGKTHAELYSKHPLIRHITIIDKDPSLFPRTSPYPIPCRFTTRMPNHVIDLASICTPTYTHQGVLEEIAGKTRAVLIEKPLSLTRKEGIEMKDTANKEGITARIAMVERFNPPIKNLRDQNRTTPRPYLQFTRIGSIPSSSWYSDQSKSGGPVIDMGIHDIDLATWLTGEEVCSVKALQDGPLIKATLTLTGRRIVDIITGWVDRPGYFFNSINDGNSLHLDGETLDRQRYPLAYGCQISAFIESLGGKSTDLPDMDEAIRSIEIAEAILSCIP